MDQWLTVAERAGRKSMWSVCAMNKKGKEMKGGRKPKHHDRREEKGKGNVRPTEWRTLTSRVWREGGTTQRTMRKMKEMYKLRGGFGGGNGKPIIPTGPPGDEKMWLHKEKELKGMGPKNGPRKPPEKGNQPETRQRDEGNHNSAHHKEEMGKVMETLVTEDSYEILSTEPIIGNAGNQENLSTTEEG